MAIALGADSGPWDALLVAEAIERALQTVKRLPGGRPARYRSAWPDYRREFSDVVAQLNENSGRHEDMRAREHGATTADIAELSMVLDWLIHLSIRDRKLVSARATLDWRGRPVRWRKIGFKFKRNKRTLQRWWTAALVGIADRANGVIIAKPEQSPNGGKQP